jgi:hypothetical protein
MGEDTGTGLRLGEGANVVSTLCLAALPREVIMVTWTCKQNRSSTVVVRI